MWKEGKQEFSSEKLRSGVSGLMALVRFGVGRDRWAHPNGSPALKPAARSAVAPCRYAAFLKRLGETQKTAQRLDLLATFHWRRFKPVAER